MVVTDTRKLIAALKRLTGQTWRDIAKLTDRDPSNVQHTLERCPVKRSFVEICESMGYDIRISLERHADE